jgi:molybdate transport system ATP-binding protein
MMHINVAKELQGAQGGFRLDVQLDIAERSLVALSGVSGSGKTTLLRLISGLAEPDSGEIVDGDEKWFSGSEKINLKTQQRKIGFVFQEFSLFPNMTVCENIEYAGADKNTISELLGLVELENLSERYPATLSGGQKQRVALVRAIARRPKILLLDEPFSTLDAAMKAKLQDELLRIHEKFQITTIIVSHDMSEMYRLCSRMITLESGRVAKDGTPQQILTNRESSHKFAFTGRIIDIKKSDIVYTVLISAGNTISEVVISANDARELRPGDDVIASTKAFQPVIRKLHHT